MTILPLGVFIFAPVVAAVTFHFVAPIGVGFGVAAAVVAFVVAFYLWPFVAFALCWPLQSAEFRRDFREHFRRKRTPDA